MTHGDGRRRRVTLAIGDPAGIGCEIVLKALADERVRTHAGPFVIVGDYDLISRCNDRFSTSLALRRVNAAEALRFDGGPIEVLHVDGLEAAGFEFGRVSAANGAALVAYARTAITLAVDGLVDVVVAAPQNQTSVKLAGIAFDGYGSLVARATGTPDDETFLMVLSERFRIAHVTLHVPLREVLQLVRPERVLRVIRATDRALRRMGIERPSIAVSGLNPHAGEGGLFGDEEATAIEPAIAAAREQGIDAHGPFGADVMLGRGGYDAYVVMFHDQGHIPAKIQHGSAGMNIGVPILFASVAHGSAHDIAGRGIADPENFINAILWTVNPRTAHEPAST